MRSTRRAVPAIDSCPLYPAPATLIDNFASSVAWYATPLARNVADPVRHPPVPFEEARQCASEDNEESVEIAIEIVREADDLLPA